MKGRELRAEARIAVQERGTMKSGTLHAGDDWFPCMVHNMSDSGFLILCNKDIGVGQVLEFRCELFPGRTLNCNVEVRHVSPKGMGTKVVQIDPRGERLIKLYLEEQYSLKLNSKT